MSATARAVYIDRRSYSRYTDVRERVEAPMYLWDHDKARLIAETLYRKHQEWQRGEHLQEFLVNRGVAWKVGLPAEDAPRLPSASDTIDDLYWYFMRKAPVSAMADLLRPSDLADWANSVIGENAFYSEVSDRTEMAKTILAESGVPLPPTSKLPYSLDAFQQRLGQIRDQLLQYENDGDIPDGTLRGLVLDGWTEFETLLRLTLVFWKHALGQEFEHEWLGVAIDSALAQRSLNALVERGFKSLKQFLQSGVPERVSKQRIEGQTKQQRELRKRYDSEERVRRKEKLRSWSQDRESAKQTLIDSEEYKVVTTNLEGSPSIALQAIGTNRETRLSKKSGRQSVRPWMPSCAKLTKSGSGNEPKMQKSGNVSW